MVGFGMAGILRRFLVKPAAMYWPGILSQVALFVGFHEQVVEEPNSKYKMSRFKFFWIAAGIFFVYTWLPEYFVTVLSSISLICFVAQDKMIKFLSSSSGGNGVGLGALTLNWNYIGGSVLTSPFWATVQFAASGM
jgi:hypothetical protein